MGYASSSGSTSPDLLPRRTSHLLRTVGQRRGNLHHGLPIRRPAFVRRRMGSASTRRQQTRRKIARALRLPRRPHARQTPAWKSQENNTHVHWPCNRLLRLFHQLLVFHPRHLPLAIKRLEESHQPSLSPEYSHPFCNYDCIAEWRIQRHGHSRHHHHNNLNVLLCAPHGSSPRASPGPGNAYPALPAHTPRRGPALRGAGLGHMVRRHHHGVLTAALGMALPGPLRPRLCARGMLTPLLCLLGAESYQLVVSAWYFYR